MHRVIATNSCPRALTYCILPGFLLLYVLLYGATLRIPEHRSKDIALPAGAYYREINFLACATPSYEFFLPLYAFCALWNHKNAVVEMVVVNVSSFLETHAPGLAVLRQAFGAASILVREYEIPPEGLTPNTVRFLEVPSIRATYTYIGDVDIMLLESILPFHIARLAHFGLPYSNRRRTNTNRLTGLHFVHTETYYTTAFRRAQLRVLMAQRRANDELELFELCKSIHGMMPKRNSSDIYTDLRPIFGMHLSPNRSPMKTSARVRLHFSPSQFKAWQTMAADKALQSLLSSSPASLRLVHVIEQVGRELLQ